MKEETNIYNIEKKEANRFMNNIDYQKAEVIYNISGDLIIEHPITGETVYIPTIQSILRKEEIIEGDFFKKEPEWVDFEQGYIIEQKEVDEIINKLENDKIQLVLGAPASGKSICLKNVGFRLAKKDGKVYMIELKKLPRDEIKLFFDYIQKINDNEAIFIVDDAHLYTSDCERLIRNFKGRGKGKLIIGSRPTEDILTTHPKKTSEFQVLNKTCINKENVTEEIIRKFLNIKHHFDDERIITLSGTFEIYKKDLWLLSWALKSYNPEKESVKEEEIYNKVRDSVRNISKGKKSRINAENVFLPLSVLYRLEIPIERDFLEVTIVEVTDELL